MRVDIAWWNLDGSGQSIESLREHLRGASVEPWKEVSGLRLKFWIADRTSNRWGAVMLWQGDRRPDQLPRNRALELIGAPPAEQARFQIEATVEGLHNLPRLGGLGAALVR